MTFFKIDDLDDWYDSIMECTDVDGVVWHPANSATQKTYCDTLLDQTGHLEEEKGKFEVPMEVRLKIWI